MLSSENHLRPLSCLINYLEISSFRTYYWHALELYTPSTLHMNE